MTTLAIDGYFASLSSRFSDADAATIGPVLEELATEDGIDPRDVLEVAQSEESPLFPYFEWDDSAAAHKYRLAQARNMVSAIAVRVVLPDGSKKKVAVGDVPRLRSITVIKHESQPAKKQCAKCKRELPLGAFSRESSGKTGTGLHSYCRQCRARERGTADVPLPTVEGERVCATPGCGTKLRQTNLDEICGPCDTALRAGEPKLLRRYYAKQEPIALGAARDARAAAMEQMPEEARDALVKAFLAVHEHAFILGAQKACALLAGDPA